MLDREKVSYRQRCIDRNTRSRVTVLPYVRCVSCELAEDVQDRCAWADT